MHDKTVLGSEVENTLENMALSGLKSQIAGLEAELASQRLIAKNAARERDWYVLRLAEAEQRITASSLPSLARPSGELAELRNLADQQAAELQAIKTSKGWRVLQLARKPLDWLRSRGVKA